MPRAQLMRSPSITTDKSVVSGTLICITIAAADGLAV